MLPTLEFSPVVKLKCWSEVPVAVGGDSGVFPFVVIVTVVVVAVVVVVIVAVVAVVVIVTVESLIV